MAPIPGEFELIKHLVRKVETSQAVVVGPGDDATVVRVGDALVAATVDAVVEERHFSFRFSSPEDVGHKALETCVSDIFAMGGLPTFVLVGVQVAQDWSLSTLDGIYEGLYDAAKRVKCQVLGGDTVRTEGKGAISVTAFGEFVTEGHLCRRSGARPGDQIWISGCSGESRAGLELLIKAHGSDNPCVQLHRRPQCRDDCARVVSEYATSMIDISDGLSSDVNHLADASGHSFCLREEALPLSSALEAACEIGSLDPLECVLHGGESYQLVYTLPPEQAHRAIGVEIGWVEQGPAEVYLYQGKMRERLIAKGWDHFRSP